MYNIYAVIYVELPKKPMIAVRNVSIASRNCTLCTNDHNPATLWEKKVVAKAVGSRRNLHAF